MADEKGKDVLLLTGNVVNQTLALLPQKDGWDDYGRPNLRMDMVSAALDQTAQVLASTHDQES